MSPDRGEQPRRPTEPLIAAVSDGVAAGYDSFDRLLQGARESLLRRSGAREPGRPAAESRPAAQRRRLRPPAERRESVSAGSGRPLAPSELIDEIAGLLAEALERGADLAQEVAGFVDERPWSRAEQAQPAPLSAEAAAGGTAKTEFRVSNTGSTPLLGVELSATELVWGRRRIGIDAVSFEPAGLDRVRPGGSETVAIAIEVPDEAEPGVYRGLIEADPGGAWAVLELTVAPGDQAKAATTDEDERGAEAL